MSGSKMCIVRTSAHSSAFSPSLILVAGSSRAVTVSADPASAAPESAARSASWSVFAVSQLYWVK